LKIEALLLLQNRRGYKGGAMRAEAPPPLGLR